MVELQEEFGLQAVGRIYSDFDPNAAARSGADAILQARLYVDSQREKIALNPKILWWCGPNEPVFGMADDPANIEAFRWYSRFEAERCKLYAEMGKKAVVGNFSMGTPDLALWPYFLEAFEALKVYGGKLGLHEYQDPLGWPAFSLQGAFPTKHSKEWYLARRLSPAERLRSLYARMTLGTRMDLWLQEERALGSEDDWTWLFLRCTRVHDIAVKLGYSPRMLITECGTATGFLDMGYPAEDYARYLARYEQGLRNLPYVDGAMIFTSGSPWGGFLVDNHPVLSTLATLVPVGSGIEPEPPPVPEYPYLGRVNGWAFNLRFGPGGLVVTFVLGGRVMEITGEDGDWRSARLWIHKSGITKVEQQGMADALHSLMGRVFPG